MNRERALAAIARRQHGVFTLDQALQAGWSPSAVRRAVTAGRFARVTRAVFSFASSPPTWRQRAMAAVLAAGAGAVASHTTAAALYGLSCCRPEEVEITVARGRSHRSPLAKVHQAGPLLPADVTTVERIPATRPSRTLIDLAGGVSRRVLEEAVDDALVRGLVTLDRLARRAEQLASPGRAGGVALREVLATWDDAALPQSVAEMRLVRRLVAHGLPAPVLQYKVRDAAGRVIATLDAAYPDELVDIEMQGFRWHATPKGFARDQARARRLAALGWLIVPATPVDLRGDGAELAGAVDGARSRSLEARRAV